MIVQERTNSLNSVLGLLGCAAVISAGLKRVQLVNSISRTGNNNENNKLVGKLPVLHIWNFSNVQHQLLKSCPRIVPQHLCWRIILIDVLSEICNGADDSTERLSIYSTLTFYPYIS